MDQSISLKIQKTKIVQNQIENNLILNKRIKNMYMIKINIKSLLFMNSEHQLSFIYRIISSFQTIQYETQIFFNIHLKNQRLNIKLQTTFIIIFLIVFNMGNSKSIQSFEVLQPLPSSWVKYQSSPDYDILQNIHTGQQIQQYSIPLEGELESEYSIYQFRKKQTENLVSVINVTKKNEEYLCAGHDTIQVRTQFIYFKLSDLKTIPISQSLYVLQTALIGFKAIYELAGYVAISEELIGFTKFGLVKVWLNKNFGKNHCESSKQNNQIILAERMISQLFHLVQEHTIKNQFPVKLRNRFQNESPNNFNEALSILKQFAQAEKIYISSRVSLFTEYFKNPTTSMKQGVQISDFNGLILKNKNMQQMIRESRWENMIKFKQHDRSQGNNLNNTNKILKSQVQQPRMIVNNNNRNQKINQFISPQPAIPRGSVQRVQANTEVQLQKKKSLIQQLTFPIFSKAQSNRIIKNSNPLIINNPPPKRPSELVKAPLHDRQTFSMNNNNRNQPKIINNNIGYPQNMPIRNNTPFMIPNPNIVRNPAPNNNIFFKILPSTNNTLPSVNSLPQQVVQTNNIIIQSAKKEQESQISLPQKNQNEKITTHQQQQKKLQSSKSQIPSKTQLYRSNAKIVAQVAERIDPEKSLESNKSKKNLQISKPENLQQQIIIQESLKKNEQNKQKIKQLVHTININRSNKPFSNTELGLVQKTTKQNQNRIQQIIQQQHFINKQRKSSMKSIKQYQPQLKRANSNQHIHQLINHIKQTRGINHINESQIIKTEREQQQKYENRVIANNMIEETHNNYQITHDTNKNQMNQKQSQASNINQLRQYYEDNENVVMEKEISFHQENEKIHSQTLEQEFGLKQKEQIREQTLSQLQENSFINKAANKNSNLFNLNTIQSKQSKEFQKQSQQYQIFIDKITNKEYQKTNPHNQNIEKLKQQLAQKKIISTYEKYEPTEHFNQKPSYNYKPNQKQTTTFQNNKNEYEQIYKEYEKIRSNNNTSKQQRPLIIYNQKKATNPPKNKVSSQIEQISSNNKYNFTKKRQLEENKPEPYQNNFSFKKKYKYSTNDDYDKYLNPKSYENQITFRPQNNNSSSNQKYQAYSDYLEKRYNYADKASQKYSTNYNNDDAPLIIFNQSKTYNENNNTIHNKSQFSQVLSYENLRKKLLQDNDNYSKYH